MIAKHSRFCVLPARATFLVALLTIGFSANSGADEEFAKTTLKKMSDFLAAQQTISFDFNSILQVITAEGQSLELASSGAVALNRPDNLRASRSGGYVQHEVFYDGKTLTIFDQVANIYAQVPAPATIDELLNTLVHEKGLPLPASDLLQTGSYDLLMDGVVNVKDLGSGVINGVECDYFAFRDEDIDWQIWIAQGKEPYPCRFVVNSTQIAGAPQYSMQISNWRSGKADAKLNFNFNNSTDAELVDVKEFRKTEMPQNFNMGENQ